MGKKRNLLKRISWFLRSSPGVIKDAFLQLMEKLSSDAIFLLATAVFFISAGGSLAAYFWAKSEQLFTGFWLGGGVIAISLTIVAFLYWLKKYVSKRTNDE